MLSKFKKLLMLLLAVFLFVSCSNVDFKSPQIVALEDNIIRGLEKELPNENFYFIYGIDKEGSLMTNINYRGIIYSDRLAEMNYAGGLEIGFESTRIDYNRINTWARAYEGLFREIEINNLGEKKAKELFGEKITFTNNGMTTEYMYNNIIGNQGESLERDKKSGYRSTIVNVFVDDLESIDIEEYKERTYELSRYIYDYLNYVTSLQIYIRDESYFENTDLVKVSIYKPFREKEEIKAILVKLENGGKVKENEKVTLVNNFRKGITFDTEGIFSKANFKRIISSFKYKEEFPLTKEKNIEYYDELKDGHREYRMEGEY